jgi:serine/threonine protein kinase
VYLAKDAVAGIEVAVKGLPPLVRLNKEELENVRKNFALVSRLHHPNIAAAIHLQKVEKAFYGNKSDAEKLRVFKGDTLVVMQYAPGVTL